MSGQTGIVAIHSMGGPAGTAGADVFFERARLSSRISPERRKRLAEFLTVRCRRGRSCYVTIGELAEAYKLFLGPSERPVSRSQLGRALSIIGCRSDGRGRWGDIALNPVAHVGGTP